MNDTVRWLTTCPCSDLNWQGALDRATVDDIEEALRIAGSGQSNTRYQISKTAVRKLEARLRRFGRGSDLGERSL